MAKETFDPEEIEKLAQEVERIDYPRPNITPEPTSAAMDIRRMLSDDALQRALREPGNEYLRHGNPAANDTDINPIIDPEFDLEQ